MDEGRLRLLREFADRGSISAVAAATHQTESGVSQQLRRLAREADGAILLEKRGRRLVLTDAGRQLVTHARRLEELRAELDADWARFVHAPHGQLHLASFPSGGELFLPPLLQRAEAVPGLDIVFHEHDLDLPGFVELAGDVDLAIAHSPYPFAPSGHDGLTVRHLLDEPLDLVVPTGHHLAQQAEVSVNDLRDEAWIGNSWGYQLEPTPQKEEPRPAQRAVSDLRLIETLVHEGRGIALVPRTAWRRVPRSGLTYVPIVASPVRRHLYLLGRHTQLARGAACWATETIDTIAEDLRSALHDRSGTV